MHPAGFEHAISATEQPQTLALDCAATVLHKLVIAITLASAGGISRSPSCDNVAVAMTEGHRQSTENDRFTSSYTVYREVLQSLKYINKSSSNKYFIVSTCELFASEQLVIRNSGLSEFD
jgi:hypothetical protein